MDPSAVGGDAGMKASPTAPIAPVAGIVQGDDGDDRTVMTNTSENIAISVTAALTH